MRNLRRRGTMKFASMPFASGEKKVCLLTKDRILQLQSAGYKVTVLGLASEMPSSPMVSPRKGRGSISRRITAKRRMLAARRRLSTRGPHTIGGISQLKEMQELYWATVETAHKMERMILTLPDDDVKKSEGLFVNAVDEGKLAKCFWEMFVKFFGIEPEAELKGRDKDVITFVAYLFLLVEHERLGNDTFSEKGIKPFYEFIKERSITVVKMTSRTFHNRVTKNLGSFRARLRQEPRTSKFENVFWENSRELKDFLTVREIFHATDYYQELRKLL